MTKNIMEVAELTKILLALVGRVEDLTNNVVTPELVEKYFPKGKCKERDKAEKLHKKMLIKLQSYLAEDYFEFTIFKD